VDKPVSLTIDLLFSPLNDDTIGTFVRIFDWSDIPLFGF